MLSVVVAAIVDVDVFSFSSLLLWLFASASTDFIAVFVRTEFDLSFLNFSAVVVVCLFDIISVIDGELFVIIVFSCGRFFDDDDDDDGCCCWVWTFDSDLIELVDLLRLLLALISLEPDEMRSEEEAKAAAAAAAVEEEGVIGLN